MASSDAQPIPEKNAAYRVTFPIFDNDGDLVSGASGLDSEISKDGGTFADCTNEATEIATSSGMYYLDFTSTEMNADTVVVIIKTSTTDAKTTPIVMYPREAGDVKVRVEDFEADAITVASINTGAFTADAFAANAILAATIAADAITAEKIADDAITADQLGANAIGETQIASNAITAAKIATNAITAAKIEADAIGTSEIADGAITTGTFAAGAVNAAAIGADAITSAKIADDAIATEHIATGAISADSLAADTITAASIATNAISADGTAADFLAEINAEMVDVLTTDTVSQPGQGTPASSATIAAMIAYLYKAWRNKSDQTDALYQLYNDDASTVDQKATVSESAGTFTRTEVATGP